MTEYGVVDSWNKFFVVPVEDEKYKFLSIDAETLQQKDLDIQYSSYAATLEPCFT